MNSIQRRIEELVLAERESGLREQKHKEEKARCEAEQARLMLEHVQKVLAMPDIVLETLPVRKGSS